MQFFKSKLLILPLLFSASFLVGAQGDNDLGESVFDGKQKSEYRNSMRQISETIKALEEERAILSDQTKETYQDYDYLVALQEVPRKACIEHSGNLKKLPKAKGVCFTKDFDGSVVQNRKDNRLGCMNLESLKDSPNFFMIRGTDSAINDFFSEKYGVKTSTVSTKELLESIPPCTASYKNLDKGVIDDSFPVQYRELTITFPSADDLEVFASTQGAIPLYSSVKILPTDTEESDYQTYSNFCAWAGNGHLSAPVSACVQIAQFFNLTFASKDKKGNCFMSNYLNLTDCQDGNQVLWKQGTQSIKSNSTTLEQLELD